MSDLAISYLRGGVYLPRFGLWLDAPAPQLGPERVFVSHAHADHIAAHREVIFTEPTSKFMRARLSGERVEHVLAFGQPAEFEFHRQSFQVTLRPAGHIFGSAMLFLQAEHSSLLYTGDFKLRPSLSAETCLPQPADLLIMETTYGRARYRFPPSAEVLQGVIRFCQEALNNGETPVLYGYSLGKSQEVLCGLAKAGLPLMLHGQIWKLTELYRELGKLFPAYEKYEASRAKGKVLLCPPGAGSSAMLRNLGPARTAVLTGWALDPGCRHRYQTDAAFPLSDHADFDELIDLVRAVQPKKVFTLHGFAADFAQTLRELGYDAEALSEEEQLLLPLEGALLQPASRKEGKLPERPGTLPSPAPASRIPALAEAAAAGRAAAGQSFAQFAETCLRIGSTSKKLEKTRILADYLRELPEQVLPIAATWLTGSPFSSGQNKVLQLGWAILRDALCAVAKLDHSEFGQIYLKHSDLGETAFELLERQSAVSSPLTVGSVHALFGDLQAAKGPSGKLPLLAGALQQATPLEGKYLVKILTGELRIGLKEGLVEEAIAQAFERPLDEVKNAHLLLGNLGEAARLASRNELRLAALVPFRPVKYMLASPEETSDAIWARVEQWFQSEKGDSTVETPRATLPAPPLTVWVEDKYDGIRCQLHKVGQRVALYSRDLKEITATFLELSDAARSIPADFVIDGEIVAMREEEVLSFAELQRRLGRKEGDLFLNVEIPVQLVAFDLLWFNGESLLEHPLKSRRAALEQLSPIRVSQITQAHSTDEIERAFAAARGRGNEGLVIKDPSSFYLPGRRGLAWLKLKKAFGTLDCVVVGAEYGHGKRNAVLSDYTFALRDEVSGELKTVGKAYSGLTDAEIAELTGHFLSRVQQRQGRLLAVEPDTVLEIAFDSIQESSRHASGLALRFPRILRIRKDKSVKDIDTIANARRLLKAKHK